MMLFNAAIKSLNKLPLICTYNSGRKNMSFNPVSTLNNLDLQLVTAVTRRRRDLTRLSLIEANQFNRCPDQGASSSGNSLHTGSLTRSFRPTSMKFVSGARGACVSRLS